MSSKNNVKTNCSYSLCGAVVKNSNLGGIDVHQKSQNVRANMTKKKFFLSSSHQFRPRTTQKIFFFPTMDPDEPTNHMTLYSEKNLFSPLCPLITEK